MKSRFIRVVFFTFVFLPPVAFAQSIPQLSGPMGNLIVPDFDAAIDTPSFGIMRVAPPKWRLLITPAVTTTNSADSYGASVGGLFGKRNQFLIEGRFLNINPDGAASLNQARLRGSYEFDLPNSRARAFLVGTYERLEDTNEQFSATLVGRLPLNNTFELNGNVVLANVDFDSGGSASDAIVGVGTIITLNSSLKLTADYVFENEFFKDRYSVTVKVAEKLVIGAAKDDTYWVNYRFMIPM